MRLLRVARQMMVVLMLGALLAALVLESIRRFEGPGTVTFRPVFLSAPAGKRIEERQYLWFTPCKGFTPATQQEALRYLELREADSPESNAASRSLAQHRTLHGESGTFVRKGHIFWLRETNYLFVTSSLEGNRNC